MEAVIVMCETTERPEAVAADTAELVETVTGRIVRECQRLLHESDSY